MASTGLFVAAEQVVVSQLFRMLGGVDVRTFIVEASEDCIASICVCCSIEDVEYTFCTQRYEAEHTPENRGSKWFILTEGEHYAVSSACFSDVSNKLREMLRNTQSPSSITTSFESSTPLPSTHDSPSGAILSTGTDNLGRIWHTVHSNQQTTSSPQQPAEEWW